MGIPPTPLPATQNRRAAATVRRFCIWDQCSGERQWLENLNLRQYRNFKCRYGERAVRRLLTKSAENTLCCKGERRRWRIQRTEAGAAVAECEGLCPLKHDASTATRHYRAFLQRRRCAAAAGAVLKPSGGNCAVLPRLLCVSGVGQGSAQGIAGISGIAIGCAVGYNGSATNRAPAA